MSQNAQNEAPTILKQHLSSVPIRYRGIAERALLKSSGKANALKAKCQECVGYEDVPDRVRNCTEWKCPLWQFRPYQEKGESNAG